MSSPILAHICCCSGAKSPLSRRGPLLPNDADGRQADERSEQRSGAKRRRPTASALALSGGFRPGADRDCDGLSNGNSSRFWRSGTPQTPQSNNRFSAERTGFAFQRERVCRRPRTLRRRGSPSRPESRYGPGLASVGSQDWPAPFHAKGQTCPSSSMTRNSFSSAAQRNAKIAVWLFPRSPGGPRRCGRRFGCRNLDS